MEAMPETSARPSKRVLVAKPRGYCAGVDRAVLTVEKALEAYGAPVYVRKQIVHNAHVVRTLEAQGAIFVEETEEVPEGATVVFSAHGVAPTVHAEAKVRQLKTIDATCPLVTKVHMEAKRFAADDLDIVLIGHEGTRRSSDHRTGAEHIHLVDGVEEAAQVQVRDPAKVAYLSQTTLSVDETNTTVDALRRASRCCRDRRRRTSATPPRTARWRSRRSPTSPTSCSWWARATAPTRCAWSRSRWTPAPGRPTSWTTPPRSTRPGWTA
jgi:(E)-4-hydroxy-3-methyl-but-2-enyl pyrophosphate reductase